ncbi:MAG: four helix bundle protein [Candidatus Parcubacteria bacterium]|nr:four helix bundle protein [Candidatus Parcubacteria bacterium]
METFRFADFPVYKKSKVFYKNILIITQKMRDFELKDQIRRAALSVILNIAEGSAKKSDKDFAKFLQISLGSINEVFACLDIMNESKLISQTNFEKLKLQCADIAKQLGGFAKKLRVNC